jgi:hypothetical protein
VGHQKKREPAPEGRKKLIPDISLVVGHVVLLKEGDELVAKRMPPMMRFLLRDISI